MDRKETQNQMIRVSGIIICISIIVTLSGSLCALTREEIISTAQNYANELWTCDTWNIEPSIDNKFIDRRPNWPFSAGNQYTGIPYAYGAKDSINTFHTNIAISATGYNYIAGKADDKIEESYDVKIKGYAGLDCSGLVSYVNKTDRREYKLHVGSEYTIAQMFAVRAGIDETELACGVGFSFKDYSIDYAFSFHDAVQGRDDLGSSHRIGITIPL